MADAATKLGQDDSAAVVRAIERRLVAHIQAGATDCGPEAMSVDPRDYTDPARLDAEKRLLFRKLPIVAGFSSEIPNPGDVKTFDELGPAIVLIRGRDSVVRGFRNMCMHRGARLVDRCGPHKLITCPFHAWSYDLEGNLVGQPDPAAFAGAAERGSVKLMQVPAGEWGGLIFVKTELGDERIDAESWLGPMAANVARLNLQPSRPIKSDRIDVASNWKFVLNTYGESYHFSTLHPTTFAPSAYSNRNLYDRFGQHYRVTFTPLLYGDYVNKEERDWPPPPPYGGSHYIFPNTIIYGAPLEGGGNFLHMYRIYPGEKPGDSFTIMSCYRGADVPPETSDEVIVQTHDFIEMVVRTEDYGVSIQSQRNLENAPEGYRMTFGRNEIALQNVRRDIDAVLAGAGQ